MKVVNAIDFVVKVDSERHAVEAFGTNATSEAAWVIKLSHCLQNLK